MRVSEITSDRSVNSHIEQKWDAARSRWSDAQATEFHDKCIYPLQMQVERMGKDARDAARCADAAQQRIEQIMGSQWA